MKTLQKDCVVCSKTFFKEETCSKKRWEEQRKFCSIKCKGVGTAYMYKEANNPAWKGDDASYSAFHHWVTKQLGKPTTCEHCHKTNLSGKYIQWANKSHQYKRDLTDWLRLCASCHKTYDNAHRLRG